MKNIGGNSVVIREININLVRKAIRNKKQATKQQIAEETGLSIMTVATVLRQLLKQDEIFEAGLTPSNGGRPSQSYRYNDAYELVIVLFPYERDGHIYIHNAVVNLYGQNISHADTEVESIQLKSFEKIIDPLLSSHPAVKAIGIGNPGVELNGRIVSSDYKDLIGAGLVEYYEERYKLPVMVENDVNAAVMGFVRRNARVPDTTVTYLYFPDKHPPGAGTSINGKLLKGNRNFAGEIYWIPLNVQWNEELYRSFDRLCQSIAKIIISVCSIINTDIFVVNGSFIRQEHISEISGLCKKHLPQFILPEILLSGSFIEDYRSGLIEQTLTKLEPDIVLARN